MKITVIGLGLIGGSLAKSLQVIDSENYLYGVDNNSSHQKTALELDLVHEVTDLDSAISKSELILIAIPVDAITKFLPNLLDQIGQQTVIDFGSTKASICKAVANHPKRGNFVAAHPMAGTENTGPTAAIEDLYSGKVNIICEKEHSNTHHLDIALRLFEALKMKIIYMDPQEHDKHIAYVSHLSHISSFMLGQTVLDIEKDEKNIFNMAGSGFQSTVRLAMSSPQMWAPIFKQNKQNVSSALDEYIQHLTEFKKAIDTEDLPLLLELMEKANDIRRVLNKG